MFHYKVSILKIGTYIQLIHAGLNIQGRDNLAFSEPKKGFLSDFHTYAPDMMKLWAQGIKANAWRVTDEINNVAGNVASAITGVETAEAEGAIGAAAININVYGAEGQDVGRLADEVSERIERFSSSVKC